MNYGEATWWHNGNGSGHRGRLNHKDTEGSWLLAILISSIIIGLFWVIWRVIKGIVLFIYNRFFKKKKKQCECQNKKEKKYPHKRTGSYNDYGYKAKSGRVYS